MMAAATNNKVIIHITCVILAILTAVPGRGDAQSSQLFSPGNLRCACPGDTLMFICTVVGPGVTVWRGTAFDCSNQNNEILLRHSQFENGEASSTCNNDAISGRGLQNVTNSQFSSQLNFTVSEVNNGETVECGHNDGTATSRVGINTVTVILDSFNPLFSLDLTDISPRELQFEWVPVAPGCPAITYNTLSTGCGECTSSTGQTSSTCSIPSVTTTTAVCTFTVQTMACSNMFTDQVVVNLKVPSEPEITIVPHYNIGDELTRLTISITAEDPFVITGDVNSTVLLLTVFGTVPASNQTCSMVNVNATESDCYSNKCTFVVEAQRLLSNCSMVGNTISLSVATSNQLGSGPPSDNYTLDITNKFVDVLFPQTNEHILTCSFLTREDASYKTCSIIYGIQPQQLIWNATNSSTSSNVTVSLDNARGGTVIYYSVNASNTTFTVIVGGSYSVQGSSSTPYIIAGFVIVLVLLIVTVLIIVIAIVVYKSKRPTNDLITNGVENPLHDLAALPSKEAAPPTKVAEPPSKAPAPPTKVTVPPSNAPAPPTKVTVPPSKAPAPPGPAKATAPLPRFKVLQVDRDCELKEFIEENELDFRRGCAFYEFIHEIENISNKQEVVLKDKSTGEYVTGEKAAKKIKAPREGIRKPKRMGGYTIYVQSIGSGARHLSPGSSVLYETPSVEGSPTFDNTLMPVNQKRVKTLQLAETCTFGELIAKHDVKYPTQKVYLEAYLFKSLLSAEDVINVLIFDKDSAKVFKGDGAVRLAKQVVDPSHYSLESDPPSDLTKAWEAEKIQVLICHKIKKGKSIKEGSLVLIENTESTPKKLFVLPVNSDEDYIQLSEFITRKGYKFENGRAYYEFVRDEEDIMLDTEIILMDKKSGELLSGPDTYKQIAGAPGWRIKRPDLEKYRVFVQSESQGSRCVRAGTCVIYDVSETDH